MVSNPASEEENPQTTNNESIYQNLAPRDDLSNINVYLEALQSGLDDRKVNNLALTGAYGSGKSSILRTFEDKYKNKYQFLNISLASFVGKESVKKQNRLIELSILQLHCPPNGYLLSTA